MRTVIAAKLPEVVEYWVCWFSERNGARVRHQPSVADRLSLAKHRSANRQPEASHLAAMGLRSPCLVVVRGSDAAKTLSAGCWADRQTDTKRWLEWLTLSQHATYPNAAIAITIGGRS